MSELKSHIKSAIEQDPHLAITLILKAVDSIGYDPNLTPTYMKLLDKIAPEVFHQEGFLSKKIAILSGYTFQPFKTWIQLHLLKRRIYAQFWISAYGLYEQAIYSQDADLVEFKPDICYFFVGRDHLHFEDREKEIERWLALWLATHECLQCEIVMNDFELPNIRPLGNYELKFHESKTNYVLDVNRALAKRSLPFVHFNSVSAQVGYYGAEKWRDHKLYDMSKIPVSPEFWPIYGENVAAVIAGIFGKSRKCLVLDLDNTLWGGVIGDDGISGIQIDENTGPGEAFRRFQTNIKELKQRGIILAVCSKNNESIAKEAFLKRSEMILKLEDFSCFIANWESKDKNLITIARTLNIGLDTIVFVDDNPAERELIRQNLPEVNVLELPEDPADYAKTLGRCLLFEIVSLTQEDIQRTATYQTQVERDKLITQLGNYDDYLANLEMTGTIAPFEEASLPRITQLINKTNQFNLTTRRYTETQIRTLLGNPSYLTWSVTLNDRFSNYGLISVGIGLIKTQQELEIDSWLMSCRVLKRGVEYFLFKSIINDAISLGLSQIRGRYIPTSKNVITSELYAELGFIYECTETDGSTVWLFDLLDEKKVKTQLNKQLFVKS